MLLFIPFYMGWMVVPKMICLNPENVILFGKRIFPGVIKFSVLRWHHPGLPWVGLQSSDKCSRDRRVLTRDTETWRKRPCVNKCRNWSDVATRNADSSQKLEEARNDSAQSLQGKHSLPTPWFGTSALQNCVRIDSCFKLPSLWEFVMAGTGN